MRKVKLAKSLLLLSLGWILSPTASAKSLSSTLEVYVFPKSGQEAPQQSKDEAACYEWATSNTGSDPFDLQKQSIAEVKESEQDKAAAAQAGKGAGAAGAIKGAAAGAIIGEIADDDASKGAGIGAAVGLLRGRRAARAAQDQATNQAEQHSQAKQQATKTQMENFKKAFSVCLEAKDYMVKY